MEYFYLMIGNFVLCILVHIRGKIIGRKEQLVICDEQTNEGIKILIKEKHLLNKEIDILQREVEHLKRKKND